VVIREFPLGESHTLRSHADHWLGRDPSAPERPVPAAPKPAATVMFVRDGSQGVEVFMLRRVATMAFAPRMTVFPGGGVDPRDADPGLPWAGPSAAEWATLLQAGEKTARELVAAAVREVFEECGVLLAGPSPDEVIADVRDDHWREQRRRLLAREASLSEVLLEHGLVLHRGGPCRPAGRRPDHRGRPRRLGAAGVAAAGLPRRIGAAPAAHHRLRRGDRGRSLGG
jgi:8-oxo-dGTP pyrophosphatase MutT (NUDIX family)